VALDDHWEWFRRVIEGRKEREGDPVIAILEQCLSDVRQIADDDEAQRLERRVDSLLVFVREFDHALSGVLRADTDALRKFFAVLAHQDERDLDRLLTTLARVPEDELTKAVSAMSAMSPAAVRRLLSLVGHPAVARLVRGRGSG
jgi:hypothetical protein